MSKRNDSFFDGPKPGGGSNTPSLYLAADRETAPAPEPTPEWQLQAQDDVGNPLLQAMVWLTQHFGLARSAESLLAGASVDGALGPDQAMRMMREAGYNAGLVRRKIDDINPLLMPAVLLLNDGDACVLVRRLDAAQPQPQGHYEVIFPGAEANIRTADAAALAGEHNVFTMRVTPQEK